MHHFAEKKKKNNSSPDLVTGCETFGHLISLVTVFKMVVSPPQKVVAKYNMKVAIKATWKIKALYKSKV